MRKEAATAVMLALLAGGCAMNGSYGRPHRPRPPHGGGPGREACAVGPAQRFVGQPSGRARSAQKAAGARELRVARAGQPVTMDFRPDRLTVELGGLRNDRIVSVRCG